jgi:hypothetical protein
MQDLDMNGIIDELDDILEAERSALLSGELDEVGRLVPRKEALVDQLTEEATDNLPQLRALSEKVKRNQGLLDSSLEGIRTVARRLASLRRVRTALDTYDAYGAKQTIDVSAETSVEKRA